MNDLGQKLGTKPDSYKSRLAVAMAAEKEKEQDEQALPGEV